MRFDVSPSAVAVRLAAFVIAVGAVGACDSNPTPHPQGDTARFDTAPDASVPSTDEGPDDNDDGVPDCTAAGGFWDGDQCHNDIGAVDTSAPVPGTDTADTADTDDAGDAADGADVGDEGPDGSSGADAADGADASDDAADDGPDVSDDAADDDPDVND